MIIKGLRAIGLYMGVSGMTILRWHKKYDDWTLNFPLAPFGTGIGNAEHYFAETELIVEWLRRLCRKDATEARMAMRSHVRMSVCRMASKDSARGEGT